MYVRLYLDYDNNKNNNDNNNNTSFHVGTHLTAVIICHENPQQKKL